MALEVERQGVDEVGLATGKHLVDAVPLLHDEFVGDFHLRQYQVEHLDIVARWLTVGIQELEGLEVPVGSNHQRVLVSIVVVLRLCWAKDKI